MIGFLFSWLVFIPLLLITLLFSIILNFDSIVDWFVKMALIIGCFFGAVQGFTFLRSIMNEQVALVIVFVCVWIIVRLLRGSRAAREQAEYQQTIAAWNQAINDHHGR